MTRKLVLLLFGFAISIGIFASDFEVRIVNYPKEVPLGAPVEISVLIKNVSGHPIVIAKGHGGFRLHLNIRRTDGRPRKGCKPTAEAEFRAGFVSETISKDWNKESVRWITCDDEAGEWIVSAELTSTGPYPKRGKGQIGQRYIDAWDGRVVSNEVHIKIVRPTGIDQKVYNLFKGCPRCDEKELLRRYPSSTYAGYILVRSIPTNSSPVTEALNSLNDPENTLHKWADQGGGEQQILQTSKKAEESMKRYIKEAGPFLEAHPDFFYAPLIRRYYAMCLGLTGDVPGAMDQIYILAKGQGKEAEEAQQYLIERESEKDKK